MIPTVTKAAGVTRLKSLLPEVWDLMRPRRGILAIGFVLMVVNRVSGLVLPASTKYLVDDVVGRKQIHLLVPLILVVLGATVVQGVTSYSLTQVLSVAAQKLIAELRRKVQAHIGRLPVTYFDSNKSGTLVSRIMSDVEGIRNLIGTGLVEFAGGILTAVISFIVLMTISPRMTGMALVLVLSFSFFLQKALSKIRPIFKERGKITAEVTGRLTEFLGGIRVVKGYHAEAREENVFASGVQRLLDNVLKSLGSISLMTLSATLLLGIVSSLVMYLGARQILAGTLTLGDFFKYTAFLALLVAPVFQIVAIGTQLSEALAGLERTREVMAERQEDKDPRRTIVIQEIHGRVRFDHVNFSYERGKPVLHDVSFLSEPGTVTALVGSSGSGKSTIIGLITAFHAPDEGTVWIDEVDLSRVNLSSYRSQLGVVLQESFLFDGSIRDNVAFSRPGATEEQILEACRIANVSEFVERFHDRYETIVGERGVKLSGGQRQRVSIARAILADPRILILDEATSSLDSESEALIQEGLKFLMQGRTTFVIAHRLSTIRRANQILVVEAGRIAERGTHEELYGERGRYFDLYTRQHGLEMNLFLAPGEGA
ncbi:MAG: ABC transporter ATP-binding protein/permease [Acidobacteriota bacterium]|nr:ABC transporter ATP-binding protein/permease [Acidobacteriota bacterium]